MPADRSALEQVYDVFAYVMPNQKRINVHNEAEPTAKLIEYLKAVKYKPKAEPVAFRFALANGEREVLHAILNWVLSQLPVLQKRAMIGYYLAMPEIPSEFKAVQVRCLDPLFRKTWAIGKLFRQQLMLLRTTRQTLGFAGDCN